MAWQASTAKLDSLGSIPGPDKVEREQTCVYRLLTPREWRFEAFLLNVTMPPFALQLHPRL